MVKEDTSVRRFAPDGSFVDYASVEEASAATGVSVAAIRIRCNKPGNHEFEWADEKTRKSSQARKSRSKGHGYELKVIKELAGLGFKGLVSSRSQSKRLDNAKIDIAETSDKLSCYVQCKNTSKIPNVPKISGEVGLKDRPLAIFWKKADSYDEEYVIIPKCYFYELLGKYHNE